MKNLIILFLSVFLMSSSFAQTNTNVPDPKLIDAFGQETVDYYINNAPHLISYYNFFLYHSYNIMDIPEGKMESIENIPVFKIKEKFISEPKDYSENGIQNLNILKYDFKIDLNSSVIYRLEGTNKMIVFISGKEIQTTYNKSIQSTK